jgi:hypothetical protein
MDVGGCPALPLRRSMSRPRPAFGESSSAIHAKERGPASPRAWRVSVTRLRRLATAPSKPTAYPPLAAWLRRSEAAYIVLNACQILAIRALLGSVLLLDLRLLGSIERYPVTGLAAPLATMATLGAVAAKLTGSALFTVRPDAYLAAPAFLAERILIALAHGECRARPCHGGVATRRRGRRGDAVGAPGGRPFSRALASRPPGRSLDRLSLAGEAGPPQTRSRPSGSGSCGHIGRVIFL